MSAVARRYAKALFELAQESNTLEAVAEQLDRLTAVALDPSVDRVMVSPLLSPAQRSGLAQTLATELGLSDLLTRFLRFLADQKRLGSLAAINEQFGRMIDSAMSRVRITIRTSMPLDEAQQAEIVSKFSTLTGKQVLPSVVIDPALLGGVVVEAAGKVYDGSIRTQLNRLAAELAGTASL